jgi:FkbM family methyltransferase
MSRGRFIETARSAAGECPGEATRSRDALIASGGDLLTNATPCLCQAVKAPSAVPYCPATEKDGRMGTDSEGTVARARRIVRNLGPRCSARFVILRLFGKMASVRTWRLHPRRARHPLVGRSGSSDLDVFGQVFSGDEYGLVSDLENVSFIIDGGANVGYSAAYFLSCYPAATVVSIEPDPDNAVLLRRNLAPYGERSVVIEGALWSRAQDLLLTSGFRDGRHWSRQVVPLDGNAKRAVPGMTVGDVLARRGVERISILKLDIEGAEAELFRDGYGPWIGAVDTFVVELHDDAGLGPATERFRAALADHNPVYAESGELTIAFTGSTLYAAGTG